MNAITIQQTLLECGSARMVLANDAEARPLVGLSCVDEGGRSFVQIDRVTMLELERGMVDVRTVIAERCAGLELHD